MTQVAILGCGPTGLAVAHAAALAGADIAIFSKARKSHMFGAQYLHAPIEKVECGEPVNINYALLGDADVYRSRVYGDRYNGSVSVEELDEAHEAWDIRQTYDRLWELYGSEVDDTTINPGWIVGTLSDEFDAVFSTVPAPQLCVKGHEFKGQDIWAYGDAPERDQRVQVEVPDNTVLCNGLVDGEAWYRASNIFSHKTVEWSLADRPKKIKAARFTKPLSNDCTCWPQLTRLGRFGKWTKGILVHHAYQEAKDILS